MPSRASVLSPLWVRCAGGWYCTAHRQRAEECPCPPVHEVDFDPYAESQTEPRMTESPIDRPRAKRGRPPVDDKRTRRVGMNAAEWARVQEMARADGYASTSKWARERLGL